MDFLVEYSKTIYFHRALNVWLRNIENLPKQKGVLPFSKVVTFTLKTHSTSVQNYIQACNQKQMGYHLNQKDRFSLKSGKSQISMKLVENIKFSSEMHSRLVSLLEKL